MAHINVLVPLAQGCEELEAITITDLLTRAGFNVVTAGLDEKPVVASRGITLIPYTTMDKVMEESFDIMVLPGGLPGADHLRDHPLVQEKLKKMAAERKLIGAICAAPKALAQAGLLDNKKATCGKSSIQRRHRRRGWQHCDLAWAGHGDGFQSGPDRIAGWQSQAR